MENLVVSKFRVFLPYIRYLSLPLYTVGPVICEEPARYNVNG